MRRKRKERQILLGATTAQEQNGTGESFTLQRPNFHSFDGEEGTMRKENRSDSPFAFAAEMPRPTTPCLTSSHLASSKMETSINNPSVTTCLHLILLDSHGLISQPPAIPLVDLSKTRHGRRIARSRLEICGRMMSSSPLQSDWLC